MPVKLHKVIKDCVPASRDYVKRVNFTVLHWQLSRVPSSQVF